eukprot:IDg16794t1
MVPIHKRVDKTDLASFRPIALLSHPRKVIESTLDKIIREQNTFHRAQLGFRPGYETEINLLRCLNSIRYGENTVATSIFGSHTTESPRDKFLGLLPDDLQNNLANQLEQLLTPSRSARSAKKRKKNESSTD